MKMLFRGILSAALLAAVVARPAVAQDSLAIVPGNAPIVVQLNGYEKAKVRLGTFLGNSLPDVAPKLVKQMDDSLRDLLDGRELKAVSKDGRVFVAITDLASLADEPEFAIIIPVTSVKEFKDGFLKEDERKALKKSGDNIESVKIDGKEATTFFVDRKDHVVLSTNSDVAALFAKSTDKHLGTVMAKGTQTAFLAQDVAVYVNLKMVNKQYGAQVRGFKAIIDLTLQGGGGMGLDKKQIEMARGLFNSLVALFDDGVAAVLGVEFRPEGGNLHFTAQFSSDSETNDFLKKLTPAAFKQLGAMPNGMMMYSASNFEMGASKTLTALMQSALADDEDEDAKQGIKAALKDLAAADRVVQYSGMNTIGSGIEIAEYKDAAKANAAMLKMFKSLSKSGSFGNVPLKAAPTIKENAETVGKFKFTSVKFNYDFDKAVEALPENIRDATRATMERLAGDKVTLYFGYSGNTLIQIAGKDWAQAKAGIEEYLKGGNPLDKDENFQSVRKQLPADATMLMLGDTARTLEMIVDLVKDQAAALPGFPGGGIPELKAPKGKPAFFGVAVTMKNEYTSFDMFVPVTAIQQVRKMFAPLIDGDN